MIVYSKSNNTDRAVLDWLRLTAKQHIAYKKDFNLFCQQFAFVFNVVEIGSQHLDFGTL